MNIPVASPHAAAASPETPPIARGGSGRRLIWLPKAIHAQLEGMQLPKEGLSGVIVRLFAAKTTTKGKTSASDAITVDLKSR